MSAQIVGLYISRGGVPKTAVETACVTLLGIDGDKQRHVRFHGGPERALCLYSREVMDELQAEGHGISPGSCGENVLISGLKWNEIVPGTRLKLGEISVEVTNYTAPCKTIKDSFIDGDFMRISQKKRAGESRVYVRVLEIGEIRVGDIVEVLK